MGIKNLQSDSEYTKEDILKVRVKFTEFTNKLIQKYSTPKIIYEVMALRNYNTEEMFDMLADIGMFKVTSFLDIAELGYSFCDLEAFGLINTTTLTFTLENRYIIPIRDLAGRVTAWVGWYPDNKKYITTATKGFSKSAQFFNIECLSDDRFSKDLIFVVEGIFDALTLRAYGLTALSSMGLTLSRYKVKTLKSFGQVVHIPDNDKQGKKACKSVFTNTKGKTMGWEIENLKAVFRLPDGFKDIDDFIKSDKDNIAVLEEFE